MDQPTPGTQTPGPAPGAGQDFMVKRAVAYFIDAIILGVLAQITIFGALACLAGWLLRDVVIEGRSPGKKIMGLRAMTASGGPVTINESVRRNAPFALYGVAAVLGHLSFAGALLSIPLLFAAAGIALVEAIMVLTGKERFGDQLAGTKAVSEQLQPAVGAS